jgi:SDR family mycofactocin-dependent oxidoreductase
MTADLAGKVAVVTGAARGIGRAGAIALAQAGCDLILIDACAEISADNRYAPSTPEDLAETSHLIEQSGRRVVAEITDVRDLAGLTAAVGRGVAALGRLDVVFANAGIMNWAGLCEITAEQWQATLDVNVTGVWHTLKATVPTITAAGNGGSIVITSSVCGLKGMPMQSHYVTAKHALVGLARAAAVELAPDRIRVNTVHPWGVDTAMTSNSGLPDLLAQRPKLAKSFQSALAAELIRPEDVADLVVYLAGDRSAHMTGGQFPIDRGALLI